MAKNDERNLNVTIKNEKDKSDEVFISVPSILKQLKKYLLTWIIIAVVLAVLVLGCVSVAAVNNKPEITALVSFTYSGIEKGLDPSGRTFDVNSMKNPNVISEALERLNMPLDELENIREGITIDGIKPADIIDRITTYKSVYENSANGNLAAAQAMLDVTWYPTQYTVTFDYSETSFNSKTAVEVFNTMLEAYRDYFYEQYGYNETLGSNAALVDVSDYDYPEAVDVISTSLNQLRRYVKQLNSDDTTLFRSTVTGYTFSDLSEGISTIKSIDLDKISSYISTYNLTKDKTLALAYYEYRIKALEREKTSLEEQLNAVKESIEKYVKDQIVIFGNGNESVDTEVTQASAQYDRMQQQKLNITEDLADTKQSINFYKDRKDELEKGKIGSQQQMEQVEQQIAAVNEKVQNLVELVTLTADDYYENVAFKNAYNILVPASNSAVSVIATIISRALVPLIVVEALLFVVYVMYAFFGALKADGKLRKEASAAEIAADDDNDADDSDEADGDETEEKEEKPKKKK